MKVFFTLLFLIICNLFHVRVVQAQDNLSETTYTRGEVIDIINQKKLNQEGGDFYTQEIKVRRNDTGSEHTVTVGNEFQPLNPTQLLRRGQQLIVAEQHTSSGEKELIVADIFRIPTALWLIALFFGIVLVVGRQQGLYSIIGMFTSIAILMNWIVPQILAGQDPIIVSVIAASVIAAITLYLPHGFTLKSHISLVSIILCLLFVAGLSTLAVHTAQLVGLGSEEAYFLQYGNTAHINLQGLLLAGIILGALSVLDDVTVSQISVVFQLRALKEKMGFWELYSRAIAVGRDHVASLVNTLVLAYAGANLPLFLLFKLNNQIPQWVTLNSDIIMEEVIRTLTGSIGLVLAVPLTTMIATYFALRKKSSEIDTHGHTHAL